MTTLSRIVIDPKSREAVRILSNPRRVHGELARLTDGMKYAQGRLLWRLDRLGEQIVLHIVTPAPVDLAELNGRIGRLGSQPASLDLGAALAKVRPGQRLRFSLRANVIKHVVRAGSTNASKPHLTRGKPMGLIKEEEQQEWLVRQGERFGFSVDRREVVARTLPQERIGKWTADGRRERTVTLNVVQFDGILTVTDPERLLAGLSQGIGKGKAYGFGMLTISPVTHV
ncbi:type I-E CRISPR-associated protein Cas6/Cse3/CasE [Kocuria koreensis]|jgi:CRISPR system Cascade subunit CasE|uniref:Type I-E CRISPR-associated protein Cas6/Cse3/CasE n=1 Tax=Rothia koreensis TaxID=592378 RepID=A0A7K1LID3_9MICC|nr:type I-E CRISPR-associated protein Cas6/Cse3/CasE [Rothia koreensis]MUN54870.1 type I-E CRISPR-associated protein Cas6/Cse3/CasE [Rothia koreensis]